MKLKRVIEFIFFVFLFCHYAEAKLSEEKLIDRFSKDFVSRFNANESYADFFIKEKIFSEKYLYVFGQDIFKKKKDKATYDSKKKTIIFNNSESFQVISFKDGIYKINGKTHRVKNKTLNKSVRSAFNQNYLWSLLFETAVAEEVGFSDESLPIMESKGKNINNHISKVGSLIECWSGNSASKLDSFISSNRKAILTVNPAAAARVYFTTYSGRIFANHVKELVAQCNEKAEGIKDKLFKANVKIYNLQCLSPHEFSYSFSSSRDVNKQYVYNTDLGLFYLRIPASSSSNYMDFVLRDDLYILYASPVGGFDKQEDGYIRLNEGRTLFYKRYNFSICPKTTIGFYNHRRHGMRTFETNKKVPQGWREIPETEPREPYFYPYALRKYEQMAPMFKEMRATEYCNLCSEYTNLISAD